MPFKLRVFEWIVSVAVLFIYPDSALAQKTHLPAPLALAESERQGTNPGLLQPVRGTAAAPLVVQVAEGEGAASEKKLADNQRLQDSFTTRWTMFFTGGAMFIGLLQAGFFYWQLRLMRRTVADTALAAKAADLSSRAAVGMELPILRLVPSGLFSTSRLIADNEPYGASGNDLAPERFSAVSGFTVENHGRTPAFPESIAMGWCVATTLPGEPHYQRKWPLNHAATIKSGVEYHPGVHLAIELTDDEIAQAGSEAAWLWVYGCIYYMDFLQEKREAKFCWRYANRNFDTVFYYFASDGEPPAKYLR